MIAPSDHFLKELLQRVMHPPDWLVVDEMFHALTREAPGLAGLEILRLEDLHTRLAQGLPARNIVLAFAADARPTRAELSALLAHRGSAALVLDLKHDGLAAMIARKPLSQLRPHEAPPTVNYAILCAPRSGSTLLTELLTSFGIGEPREHIRPEVIQMLRAGDVLHFDPAHWLAAAQSLDRTGEIFGTKVIMHLLLAARKAASPEQLDAIMGFTDQVHLIQLIRRDKVKQAISQDRARETSVFHVFDSRQLDAYRRRSEAWSYDFDRIKRSLDQVLAQEEEIERLIGHVGRPVHRVDYDALVAAPREEVAAICRFIGVELRSNFVPQVQLQKLADEKSRAFHDRFMADHLALLGRPAPHGTE